MKRHILVVLPHPDDEAFGLAGTLAKHIDQGVPVTYICLTLGEMGRNLAIRPSPIARPCRRSAGRSCWILPHHRHPRCKDVRIA